jgi:hypothetical protein
MAGDERKMVRKSQWIEQVSTLCYFFQVRTEVLDSFIHLAANIYCMKQTRVSEVSESALLSASFEWGVKFCMTLSTLLLSKRSWCRQHTKRSKAMFRRSSQIPLCELLVNYLDTRLRTHKL